MHQDNPVVAPLGSEPHWLAGYFAVWCEPGAQERNIPYFIGRVRQYFAACPGRKRRDSGRPEIEAFLP
jgi:hypothetical protein